jgi:filamentous hemagglutinin family protein
MGDNLRGVTVILLTDNRRGRDCSALSSHRGEAMSRSICACLVSSVASVTFFTIPAVAQLTPDNTLGPEATLVTPDTTVQGTPATLIEGGAVRGSHLFHSFSDFNVDTLQRVYFANPIAIETILTRVTGDNGSFIDGTLGVDGPAALYLLNPNGIAFGPNARLDIRSSFVASTAAAWDLGNGTVFSAVNPNVLPLLTVSL